MTHDWRYTWMDSPLGAILLARDAVGLRTVAFGEGRRTQVKPRAPEPGWQRDESAFALEREQLEAYFAGELRCFTLPLEPVGTDFQRMVWRGLLDIPYGETVSYGQLAARVGRPGAARAVGAANGANPIGIVIPCHRVIGADGSLTGYGGGIENKEKLLALEQGQAGQLGLRLEPRSA